jgi:hypothetical protein
MNCRLYLFRDGHIIAGQSFLAFSDEEALEMCSAVYDDCSDVADSCEVWHGDQLKAAVSWKSRRARFPVETALQANIVELEEALSSSFACIRESRRLFASRREHWACQAKVFD